MCFLFPPREMSAEAMSEAKWLDNAEKWEAQKIEEVNASLSTPTVNQDLVQALFKICSDATLSDLQSLLKDPMALEAALAVQDRRVEMRKRQLYNLHFMLDFACHAGNAPIIKFLLNLAETHYVPLETIVDREIVMAAIKSNDFATFQALASEIPSVINFNLSLCGTPLCQAIGSDIRTPLVAYLLQNGADPNGIPHYRPLRTACSGGLLNQVNLLLTHGAIIPGSGALYCAASSGHVNVLEIILQHDVDINERVGDLAAGELYSNSEKRVQISSETAMHVAVRKRQYEAVEWLREHGASTDLEDVKGHSPRTKAEEMGDARMLNALGE